MVSDDVGAVNDDDCDDSGILVFLIMQVMNEVSDSDYYFC